MNALAIMYVNAHLQDLLDEAAQHRVERPDRPSLLKRIASAASNAVGQPRHPARQPRLDVPEPSTTLPTGAEASSLQLRPTATTTPVPPAGVVVCLRGQPSRRSAGDVDVAERDAGRVVDAPGRGRDRPRRRARRAARGAAARRRPRAGRWLGRRRTCRTAIGSGRGPSWSRATARRRDARGRPATRVRTAGTSVGMSPPTTTTDRPRVERREAGREAGERALEGERVVDDPDAGASTAASASGASDHDDLGRDRADARRSRGRAAAGRRSARRACRARTATTGRRRGRRAGDRARSSARPRPGCLRARHVAGGRAPQDRPPVEVLEDRHDVLAARPGRVAERRRRERRVRGHRQAPGRRGRAYVDGA